MKDDNVGEFAAKTVTKPSTANRDNMTEFIYSALKEIEQEEGFKLSDKAFITYHLAPKILSLWPKVLSDEEIERKFKSYGWREPTRLQMVYYRAISRATIRKNNLTDMV